MLQLCFYDLIIHFVLYVPSSFTVKVKDWSTIRSRVGRTCLPQHRTGSNSLGNNGKAEQHPRAYPPILSQHNCAKRIIINLLHPRDRPLPNSLLISVVLRSSNHTIYPPLFKLLSLWYSSFLTADTFKPKQKIQIFFIFTVKLG